jgi:protein Tex
MLDQKYIDRVAQEVGIRPEQAARTIALFDDGATIPFVARYRKDVTGNLSEDKLEGVVERSTYYKELVDRQQFVIETIEKQGKLSDELRARILDATEKTILEDLYLPYKKAKKTKASVAREKGLMPLAELLWEQVLGSESIEETAATFVNADKGVATPEEALEGARHICAERVSLDLEVRAGLRERMYQEGNIRSVATKNTEGTKTKYESYYDFTEPAKSIPSHRFLAIQRGVKEGLLRAELAANDEAVVEELVQRFLKEAGSPFEPQVRAYVEDAYQRLLRPSIENEVFKTVQLRSDEEAVRVFRENAHNLLLSPPAGRIGVIGIDPGLRTGCKIAIVDAQGSFVESAVIHPTPPQNDIEGAEKILQSIFERYDVKAIAIGNGTGARETSAFVRNALAKWGKTELFCVMVNEAGASIYSASKLAREEYPELDVTIRGAISIAHRLQDPLAELVKIDPRHIGVGQYQHDVNQKLLREGLRRTVISCVNAVGVDLNTASVPLLRYISGIQSKVAKSIVDHRGKIGGFKSREQLREVDGIGPKVFEQCAGFLRVPGSENPLDGTGVHPEAYSIVAQLASAAGKDVADLIGNAEPLKEVDLTQYATETLGELTLQDIRRELARPARDPRKEFKAPAFSDKVLSVQDLDEGMDLEGIVTNVTDFGAFVDIGVHQDGLVHLSELANRFVKDPHTIVKVGDIVKVKVIKVDKDRPRISLSMKALAPAEARQPRPARAARKGEERKDGQGKPAAAASSGEGRRDGEKSRKPKRPRKPQRDQQERRPKDAVSGSDRKEPLNTMLADQLSAFKDKFGS